MMTVLILVAWFLVLLLGWLALILVIDRLSYQELDSYNQQLHRNIQAAELERLRKLPRHSRVKRPENL